LRSQGRERSLAQAQQQSRQAARPRPPRAVYTLEERRRATDCCAISYECRELPKRLRSDQTDRKSGSRRAPANCRHEPHSLGLRKTPTARRESRTYMCPYRLGCKHACTHARKTVAVRYQLNVSDGMFIELLEPPPRLTERAEKRCRKKCLTNSNSTQDLAIWRHTPASYHLTGKTT